MNETDEDERLEVEPAPEETPPSTAPKKSSKKKRAKKKRAGVAKTPTVKVDPAQALAFVRSRLRESKDPIVRALYEREIAELEQRVKAADAEKRARVHITVNGKTIKLGGVCYAVDGGLDKYMRRNKDPKKPRVDAFTLKSVDSPGPNQYGSVKATFARAGGGTVTIEQYRYNKCFYHDRRAAIDADLKECNEDLKKATEEVDELTARRDALLELREPKLPFVEGS